MNELRAVCGICFKEIEDDMCYDFGGFRDCYCEKCVKEELKKIHPYLRDEVTENLWGNYCKTPVVWEGIG